MPQVTVSPSEAGLPLHKFIRQNAAFKALVPSRSQCHLAFKEKQVFLNGSHGAEGARVQEGDVVLLQRNESASLKTKQTNLALVSRADPYVVVWKASGVSMDIRSDGFQRDVRSLLSLDRTCPVEPVYYLDKAVSGLVVTRIGGHVEGSAPLLKPEDLECIHQCVLLGKVGKSLDMQEGDEFAIETPIHGILCTTKVQIKSFTGSRNSPDGFLTTVYATPVGDFSQKQILLHFYESDTPVIGNSRFTKQHRTCRDKGMFLSLTSINFTHPETGESISATEKEPTKFEALRAKEVKFYDRKRSEIEEAQGAAGSKQDDDGFEASKQLSSKNPAYIRGVQEFRGLAFKVTPDVMIPRPSSSILVETAVSLFLEPHQSTIPPKIRILDMGTGSGSLLISAIKHLESSLPKPPSIDTLPTEIQGIALDASLSALQIAQENISQHNLSSTVKTILSTFATVSTIFTPDSEPVNIVLCNPPYLSPKTRTVTSIDASLLNEEPAQALYSGSTGLEAYREIAAGIKQTDETVGTRGFVRGCVLVVEIGHGMSRRVQKCFEEAGVVGDERRWRSPPPQIASMDTYFLNSNLLAMNGDGQRRSGSLSGSRPIDLHLEYGASQFQPFQPFYSNMPIGGMQQHQQQLGAGLYAINNGSPDDSHVESFPPPEPQQFDYTPLPLSLQLSHYQQSEVVHDASSAIEQQQPSPYQDRDRSQSPPSPLKPPKPIRRRKPAPSKSKINVTELLLTTDPAKLKHLSKAEKKRIREHKRGLTCFNCHTQNTPLWRRSLYFKQYRVHRPAPKTDGDVTPPSEACAATVEQTYQDLPQSTQQQRQSPMKNEPLDRIMRKLSASSEQLTPNTPTSRKSSAAGAGSPSSSSQIQDMTSLLLQAHPHQFHPQSLLQQTPEQFLQITQPTTYSTNNLQQPAYNVPSIGSDSIAMHPALSNPMFQHPLVQPQQLLQPPQQRQPSSALLQQRLIHEQRLRMNAAANNNPLSMDSAKIGGALVEDYLWTGDLKNPLQWRNDDPNLITSQSLSGNDQGMNMLDLLNRASRLQQGF
ncbi:UNVERIFIED_CONTAM: hypothetical protein HDU68_008205 [Siphonaria sp. JEL0065]|nr:hypothetical protein HDU68_008205 [Siphonaria sp. JEL0065]